MKLLPDQWLIRLLVLSASLCAVSQASAELRRSISVQQAGEVLTGVVAKFSQPAPRAVPRAIPVSVPAREPQAPKLMSRVPLRPAEVEPEERLRQGVGQEFVAASHFLATKGYPYVFGGETPDEGGFDCSGVIHYLLGRLGLRDVPRVAYDQYRWLEKSGNLRKVGRWKSPERLFSQLKPGDLLFWTGTYQTGRSPNISHVMVYMGRDRETGQPLMFGARSTKLKGLNGSAVDVYPFVYPKKGGRGVLVGFGSVPNPRS